MTDNLEYLNELQEFLPNLENMDQSESLLLNNDYCNKSRIIGFEECIWETLRYLTNVEGRNFDDPMLVELLKFLIAEKP